MATWPERLRYQPMKGSFQSARLGEDAELEGQLRKEHGRVVVAEVVGGVDGERAAAGPAVAGFAAAQRLQFFEAFDGDGGKREEQQCAGPGARDKVLLAAGVVPEAGHERDGAEEGRREGEERQQEQVSEPAEPERNGGMRGFGGRDVLFRLQDFVGRHWTYLKAAALVKCRETRRLAAKRSSGVGRGFACAGRDAWEEQCAELGDEEERAGGDDEAVGGREELGCGEGGDRVGCGDGGDLELLGGGADLVDAGGTWVVDVREKNVVAAARGVG